MLHHTAHSERSASVTPPSSAHSTAAASKPRTLLLNASAAVALAPLTCALEQRQFTIRTAAHIPADLLSTVGGTVAFDVIYERDLHCSATRRSVLQKCRKLHAEFRYCFVVVMLDRSGAFSMLQYLQVEHKQPHGVIKVHEPSQCSITEFCYPPFLQAASVEYAATLITSAVNTYAKSADERKMEQEARDAKMRQIEDGTVNAQTSQAVLATVCSAADEQAFCDDVEPLQGLYGSFAAIANLSTEQLMQAGTSVKTAHILSHVASDAMRYVPGVHRGSPATKQRNNCFVPSPLSATR